MKKLIVSGCSYTAKEFLSSAYPDLDTSWPKWPELLGKKLNMKVVNLAQDGAGNRFILQTLLDKIERTSKDKIGLVMAAWSQANRDDWQTGMPISKWSNNRIKRPGDIYGWVRESLLGYITLQNVCKRYNIPLKQFQMIGLYNGWISGLGRTEDEIRAGLPNYVYEGDEEADRQQIRLLIRDYEQFIDKDSFLGYKKTTNLNDKLSPPMWAPIEGSVTLLDKIAYPMDLSAGDDMYKISKFDEHPNELGQQKLVEVIYDRMG